MGARDRGHPHATPHGVEGSTAAGALVHLASVAIVATDVEDRVTVWNRAAETLLGLSAPEVLGSAMPALGAADDALGRASVLRRLRGREHVCLVTGRTREDGTSLEVLVEYSPLIDADGRYAGAMRVLRDVTEERAAERATRRRRDLAERLHAVVAGLSTDLDPPATLRWLADSAAELLGASAAGYVVREGPRLRVAAVSGLPTKLVGRSLPDESALEELIRAGRSSMADDADRYPDTATEIRRHLRDLHTLAVARTTVRGDVAGALYVFFAEPGRTVAPDELAVLELLAAHAGTAVANAEAYAEAVRQREHEHAVVDAMADGLAVVDRGGAVRDWNPAAEAITGLTAADTLGRPLPFPTADPGVVVDYELPSGRWIEILCTLIAASREQVVAFRDITAPKELERAKDLFLATTSHELRTPITVIMGFASTLLYRWDELPGAERREAVETIHQRAESLALLVEQLLLSSRAGTGSATLCIGPFDVVPVLRASVTAFDRISDRHRVELLLDAALPPVLADRVAVENALGQLLENALKYSPAGGHIRVRAGREADDLVVSVEDDGIGIPSADAERVFERFVQSDGGNRRRFGGVGLGLYIVRQLVEAQAGTVRVVPRDLGACVELRLPLAVAPPATPAPPSASP